MMLVEETQVPDAALPVDDFKAHLRLGSGFGDETLQDEVLKSFLRAAMAAIEARTGKALIARAFAWTLASWRGAEGQVFPIAPVQALTALELVARDGTRTAQPGDSYWLEQNSAFPQLRPAGACLPGIPKAGTAVVSFVAGYGAAFADIPADLRQAVMLLAAHYYEYRNETALSDGCMPFGVTSLIERYRALRTFAGGAR